MVLPSFWCKEASKVVDSGNECFNLLADPEAISLEAFVLKRV
jgi:hypothetical protein